MPSDVNFRFTWVPNRYGDRLLRSAVLYPLLGMCHSAAEIAEHTSRLVGIWRARLHILSEHGWVPRNDEVATYCARNCVPTFAYAAQRPRPCGNPTLCPFCYARWARSVWELVDSQFPNPRVDPDARLPVTDAGQVDELLGEQGRIDDDERELRAVDLDTTRRVYPYHLVTRFQQWVFKYDFTPSETDPQTPEQRLRHLMDVAVRSRYNKIRNRSPRGAFAHLTVEPGRHGWIFRNRELYLVERDWPTPVIRHGKIHRCEEPTRGAILQAMIRVCRYPTLLIRNEETAAKAALLLRVRHGACLNMRPARLSAMYGCFRNSRSSSDGISVHTGDGPSGM